MVKYLLDTNIISELRKKKKGNENVFKWAKNKDFNNIFLSVITIGEIRNGIEKSKDKTKKGILNNWFKNIILKDYKNKILDIDFNVIMNWSHIVVNYRTIPILDSLICATALTHNLTLITRNTKDFKKIKKVKLFNPFK